MVPGVSVVTVYGHSPGAQAVIVDLPESGRIVLTSDAINSQENIEKDIPAGNSWNTALSIDSMHRLLNIAKRDKARLFITHAPDARDTLKPSPYLYR